MASQTSQGRVPSLVAAFVLSTLSLVGCSDGITANVDPPTPTLAPTPTPSETPETPTPSESPTQSPTATNGGETPSPTATEIPTPTATVGPGVTGDILVPEDFASIQDAIDAAARGAVILVEAGTYNEDVDFKGKTLTLRSTSGPGATIINGTGTGTVVRMASGEGPGTLLKGFTIRGGIGALDQGGYRLGGGVYVANASPTIDGCILTGNYAEYGGGIAVERGEVTLTGLRVHDNESSLFGGGVAALDARIEARGMIIWNNQAEEGAGLYLNDVTGVVSNSYFNDNRAADAGGGAGIRYCDGELELVNNIFAENSAPDGASVFFLASESRFTSNIVVNSINGEAVATDSENYTPVLNYNNFWNNPDGAVGGGLAGLTGTGNLNNSNPLFENYSNNKNPLDDLLTLGEGSPCIDAGPPLNDDGIYTDADGTRNDMGLYGGPYSDDRAYGDEDGDGMPDLWEEINGLNPYQDDADEDPDNDGLTNLEEYEAGTQASIPDTDSDGVLDGEEVALGLDPLNPADNRPIAVAGENFYVEPGELATLDGSGSSDPNDDPLTFQWTLVLAPEGSAITQETVTGTDAAIATFTPDEEGVYAFELVVSDGKASSFPDRVDVITSGTLYVSPEGPITSIQRAIKQSSTGQRILVAPGTYEESIVFSKKRVRVESVGGARSTVISSPALKPVATFEKNLQNREDGFRAELIGFTLTNGFGDSIVFPEPFGGGVFITGAAPRVKDCIITRNAAANGGGISVVGGGIELVDSRVEANGVEGAGGGLYTEDPALGVYISRTVFANNVSGSGGGIYIRLSEADDLPIEITNSTFFRNTANGGNGGAIRIRSSGEGLKILNNVMVDNSASAGAGIAMEGDGDGSSIQGNIIAFNRASGVSLAAGTDFSPTFSYNDVYENGLNNYEGTRAQLFANRDGNISVDPLFARLDLLAEESEPVFVLRPGSPAIDAGPPATDFNDTDGTRNDMGIFGGPGADLSELSDQDGDGLPDYWEEDNGLDVTTPDADGDPDMDGADNLAEYLAGSDPRDADTDGDGISDGTELAEGQDPIDPADNLPVAAVAAEIVRVEVGRGAELDGTPSSDPQDDTLTYIWTLTSAPEESILTSADISGADQAVALFTPDVKGTFVFNLVVSDGRGQSAPVRLSVVASENIIVGEDGTYDTIQGAIDAAGDTDTILVREGTYIEDIDFKGKSVTVESVGGAGLTTIQGTSLSSVVSFIRGERPEATLKGFTIRGGYGRVMTQDVDTGGGTPASVEFIGGGGITIDDGASPTLEDLVVTANDADVGGGIFIRGGTATLRDVVIEGNDSALRGGGLALVQADVRVIRGLIEGNESNGVAGIYIEGGAPSITNTFIVGNLGSGSEGMGGIYISGCGDTLSIQNVTVVGNAGRAGSSLVSDGCTGDIDSSIFAFGIAGPGITLLNEALPTFLYNDVYGHPGGQDFAEGGAAELEGASVISLDPLFINYTPGELEGADLGLSPGSPCIDVGTPDAFLEDLDGTRNDMGATGGPGAQP